ncbi:MAG TPA: hypothetical protein VL400_04560, partial [Polyangiaceae bacterium]|nr:hypothetical protein [Polyangiaceae bacterium]
MKKLAPLTALALVALTPFVSHAADWHVGTPSAAVRAASSPEAKARAYLDEQRTALDLVHVDLGAARVVRTAAGAVVRFEQRVGGVPVLGGAVLVHVGKNGEVSRVATTAARSLAVDTTPSLDEDEALAELEDAVHRTLPPAEKAELVVSPVGAGTLLWQLDVRDSPGGTRYFVDAHSGALYGARALAIDALGRIYKTNSVQTPTPEDDTLDTLDEAASPVHLNGWGGLLTVTNYVSGGSQNGFEVEQTLEPFPAGGTDFLYDPPTNQLDATDGFAQVNLFFHLTTMRNFFTTLGVDQTAASWKITAVANALEGGQPLDNAFFSPMGQTGTFASPNLIAIGQGSLTDFAYDSDVFKHEFGHYVSDNAVGYNLGQLNVNAFGLSPHSGSIDEGIADYFACSQNGDPIVGEASLAPLNAERDLTNVAKVCPDDVFGEVHEDGEIIGSLSWSVRDALGAENADKIVWGAVASMPPGGTLGDFGRGLVSTTEALVGDGTLTSADLTTVQGLVAARGLDDCDEVIAIDSGETKKVDVIGLDLIGQILGGSCAQAQNFGVEMQSLFHFSHKPAATDTALRFTVDVKAMGGGGTDLTLYVRKGQNVTFKSSGFLPVVDKF